MNHLNPRRNMFVASAIGFLLSGLLVSGCGGGGSSSSGGGTGTTTGTTANTGSRAFSGTYNGFVATTNTLIPASASPVTVNLVKTDGTGARIDSAIVPTAIDGTASLQSATVLEAGTLLIQATFPAGSVATFNGVPVKISSSGQLQQNVVLAGTLVDMKLPPCTIGPWVVASSVELTMNGTTLPFSFTGSVPAVPVDYNGTTSSLTFSYPGKFPSSVGILSDTTAGFDTPSLTEVISTNPQTVQLTAFDVNSTIQNLFIGL